MIILNEQQEAIRKEAISWFKNSSSLLFEISGPAGTGKSVLISEILKSLHLNSNQFLAMAYTGSAAMVMRKKGFPYARTIHSSLYECIEVPDIIDPLAARFGAKGKRKKYVLRDYIDPNISLFFIDEAFMVPENMVEDILSFGIKVIVAGDHRQLPPIGGNPAFLVGPNVHRLTQVMRQSFNNPIVYLANRVLNNQPIHSGTYGNNVMVIDDVEVTDKMLQFADCIICGTNKTREFMNSYI